MGNKAKNKTMTWVVVAVVVLAIAVASLSFNLKGSEKSDADTINTIVTSGANAEFCANNPSLGLDARILDGLASTKGYINGTLYLENLDTGSITSQTITSGGTSGFTSLTTVLDCKSENGYRVYVRGTGTVNSDGTVDITPDMLVRDPVEMTITSSQYSAYKVKGYDNVEKGKMINQTSGSSAYVFLNTVTFNSTANAFDATNADAIDVTFTLAPQTTSYAKGNGMIIAIDTEDASNLADFDESLTGVWYNGVKLVEATGLSENELRALNSYEHIFMVDESIGMDADGNKQSQATLRVYLEPEGDQTAKTFDPVIKIVARGDTESNKGDEILTGVGFGDDSSRTELYTAQTITLSVA